MNIDIEIGKLRGSRLIEDYVAGKDALAPFYPGWPWEIDAYRVKMQEVDTRFDAEKRRAIAPLLRATSPGAAARIEQIINGDGLVVTTGHQAGLFTGPLFTVHKILSAIRLAQALESELRRPVTPLFWVASDDHDWAEVNHTHVLDRANELQRLELATSEDAPPTSMRLRPLDGSAENALDQLVQAVPPTEFADAFLKQIRTSYRPGRGMAGAFAELIVELFSDFDLIVVDGGDPELKRLAGPLMEHELASSAEHEAVLAERSQALDHAGYHSQVPILEGATNLFLEDERGRERIFRDGSGYLLRHTGRRMDGEALRSLLRTAPERFSANVLLRPVVESAVFPTLAYVGGPGEVSYFAQVSALFERHGIATPVVFPRFSVTIVETKVRKVMEKFGLEVTDFAVPSHELAARVLREEMPSEVVDAVRRLRQTIAEGYAELTQAVSGIDPTLKGPLQTARNASHKQLAEAEKRIAQTLRKQNALGLEQLEKAQVNLFPLGKPQERVLNVYPYLIRYGRGLLREIAEAMQVRLEVTASSTP